MKVAAQTFRANPEFDTEEAITTLKTGEALVSFLDEHGAPGIVQRATILPPQSYMGAITAEERERVLSESPLKGVYDAAVNAESAYEKLAAQPPSQPRFLLVNGVLRQVVPAEQAREYVQYNGYLWPIL